MHVSTHVEPDVNDVGQLPMPPFDCAATLLHGLAEHDCGVAVPARHVVVALLMV